MQRNAVTVSHGRCGRTSSAWVVSGDWRAL